jgi:cyanophycin synthetase
VLKRVVVQNVATSGYAVLNAAGHRGDMAARPFLLQADRSNPPRAQGEAGGGVDGGMLVATEDSTVERIALRGAHAQRHR